MKPHVILQNKPIFVNLIQIIPTSNTFAAACAHDISFCAELSASISATDVSSNMWDLESLILSLSPGPHAHNQGHLKCTKYNKISDKILTTYWTPHILQSYLGICILTSWNKLAYIHNMALRTAVCSLSSEISLWQAICTGLYMLYIWS